MMKQDKFDIDKALEIILYVADKAPIPDIYHVLKIIYFADIKHISEYGRQLFGDSYIAMQRGPVPSGAYDIVKHMRGDRLCADHLPEVLTLEGNTLKPIRSADENLLSKSEIECLDEAMIEYGSLTFEQLKNRSHDSAWKSANENDEISMESIIKGLPNSDAVLEHYKNPYPEH